MQDHLCVSVSIDNDIFTIAYQSHELSQPMLYHHESFYLWLQLKLLDYVSYLLYFHKYYSGKITHLSLSCIIVGLYHQLKIVSLVIKYAIFHDTLDTLMSKQVLSSVEHVNNNIMNPNYGLHTYS